MSLYQKNKDVFIQRRNINNTGFEEYPIIVSPDGVIITDTLNNLACQSKSDFLSALTASISASYALTASYALNGGGSGSNFSLTTGSTYPITSSWSNNTVSASYSNTSSYAITASYVTTSSWSNNTISASYAVFSSTSSIALSTISASYSNTSSYSISASISINALSSSTSISASYALTSSFSFNTVSASNANTASWAINAITATTSSYANTASWAVNAITATTASNANTASWAINTTSASYALNSTNAITATSASYSLNSTNAVNAISCSWASGSVFLLGTASVYSTNFVLTGSFSSTKTTDYVLSSSDAGKFIIMNSSSPLKITVPSTLNQAFACSVLQYGTGHVTVSGSGTNILNRDNKNGTYGRYSIVSLIQVDSTNYILQGDVGN